MIKKEFRDIIILFCYDICMLTIFAQRFLLMAIVDEPYMKKLKVPVAAKIFYNLVSFFCFLIVTHADLQLLHK